MMGPQVPLPGFSVFVLWQGLANFCKRLDGKDFRLLEPYVSVVTIQLCRCSAKAALTIPYVNAWS